MRFPGVQLPLRLGDDATDIPAEARVTRVVLTTYSDDESIIGALRAGALAT